ncbi:MAG: DUF421 domain-containing protein [Alicyclobacillaceae bacterium]|nr:DUF421 domain-containing protein [Alicyclobacillaceae bacterium]
MPQFLDVVLRSVIAFAALIFANRLVGQKFAVVAGVAVGSLAAMISLDHSLPALDGVITLAVWGGLTFAIGYLGMKSNGFRSLVHGRPTVLIEQGQVLEQNLRKARMSINDMMTMLRAKNAFKLADVEFGVLETDGSLSVMKKTEQQPLTPVLQGVPAENEAAPRIVILDGHLLEKTLADLGYSQGWLLGELRKQGAEDYKDVFLAQLDGKGNLYVDLYTDTLKPPRVKSKPLVLATLKKVQADLETFSLQTQNVSAKQAYEAQSRALQQLIQTVEPYLRE